MRQRVFESGFIAQHIAGNILVDILDQTDMFGSGLDYERCPISSAGS